MRASNPDGLNDPQVDQDEILDAVVAPGAEEGDEEVTMLKVMLTPQIP